MFYNYPKKDDQINFGGGKENVIRFSLMTSSLSSKFTCVHLSLNSTPNSFYGVRFTPSFLPKFLWLLNLKILVEVRRIELLTPCLQSRCSPS